MRHRHQFQRGDTQRLEVIDHDRMTKGFIGTADLFWQIRVQPGQSFDMGFIDDRIAPWLAWRGIIPPVKRVIHDHAFRRDCRAVMRIRSVIAAVQQWAVFHVTVDTARTGIEQ